MTSTSDTTTTVAGLSSDCQLLNDDREFCLFVCFYEKLGLCLSFFPTSF